MNLKKLALVGLVLAAQTAWATPVLTPKEDTGQKIKGTSNVPIYKSAEVVVDTKPVTLLSVGTGLRKKLGVIKVYGGQVYSTDPAPLKSVPAPDYPVKGVEADSVTVVAVQMSFVHDAPVDKLLDAYKEAFVRNGVDSTAADVQAFLSAVAAQGGVANGDGTQTITVVGLKLPEGKEEIRYQNSTPPAGANPNGEVVVGPTGLIKKVFGSWLGNTKGDGGLTDFQNEVIKGAGQ